MKLNEKQKKIFATTYILKDKHKIAYMFMSVAKKAAKIPRLQDAIKSSEINVSAAKRLLPNLTEENADELIVFSKTHSHRETERKLAELGGPIKPIEKAPTNGFRFLGYRNDLWPRKHDGRANQCGSFARQRLLRPCRFRWKTLWTRPLGATPSYYSNL
jgi:hypothetical protein